uniref:J domain-containing protein n=1 Tax=Hyaloperonospora arabidopsidis (strain Emoy2) TaxID=559515 RepID=M4B698_HYAAE
MSPRGRNSRVSREGSPAKCRVPTSRKVAAAAAKVQSRPFQVKKKALHCVIDLTVSEEDGQEEVNRKQEKDKLVEAMESAKSMTIPAHLESDDYFTILSLHRVASDSDVKRAYRKLAVQWHPDKNRANPRAEEVFKKISEAYEVLSDPIKRQRYEAMDQSRPQQGAAPMPESFPFHDRGRGFSTRRARDIFDHFFGGEDPFEAFFMGGRQGHGSMLFRDDPFFMAMGGAGRDMGMGMGLAMNMHGFGGMPMMGGTFSNGFQGMNGPNVRVFSTSTSSSSSTFADMNGNVIQQKTTTATGSDGRARTVTEEFCNGKLVNSSSSDAGGRLTGGGRMQLDGARSSSTGSYRQCRFSRPKY